MIWQSKEWQAERDWEKKKNLLVCEGKEEKKKEKFIMFLWMGSNEWLNESKHFKSDQEGRLINAYQQFRSLS